MRDPRERLRDVLQAVDAIQRHAAAGQAALESNELLRTWVVHHLQIIGEAARSLAPDVKARAPDIPWSAIIGMRNVLVHGYFDIDVELVWRVVELELPPLRLQVQALLRQLE